MTLNKAKVKDEKHNAVQNCNIPGCVLVLRMCYLRCVFYKNGFFRAVLRATVVHLAGVRGL